MRAGFDSHSRRVRLPLGLDAITWPYTHAAGGHSGKSPKLVLTGSIPVMRVKIKKVNDQWSSKCEYGDKCHIGVARCHEVAT